jgi:DNA (cytosine-5)-methyltransferase 1
MNELALFAGAGGGILGGKLLGWRTVCAVERDAYAAQVLAKRQNDGILEPFPIWSDVCSFDGKPWRGIVDVVSGGFPCQDISIAGRGAGIEGKRSGLWKEFARIIGEVRPSYAFIENSPMLVIRGLETVLCDLAAMGYYAKWGYFDAETCGSNHQRGRTFILATDSNSAQCKGRKLSSGKNQKHPDSWRVSWWEAEPAIHRVDDGLAYRMDRLKAIGNGQVPIVAATALQCLMNPK